MMTLLSRAPKEPASRKLLAAVLVLLVVPGEVRAQQRLPIIDMHLHAYGDADLDGPPPPNPVTGKPASQSAAAHQRECLALMDRYNIVLAVVSGPLEAVESWRKASPTRVWASPMFGRPGFDWFDHPLPSLKSLRTMYRERKLRAMGEITAQYEGLSPSDRTLEPYFALAEQLDIPVGIHTGTGPPGTPYIGSPKFRLALGNPLLLEDLLVRHPKLRVYVMHAGAPWTRETIALMHTYPQVYLDVAGINWLGGPQNLPNFHKILRDFLAAGLGKRIMFGTDQPPWPEAIGIAVDAIESADFLTGEQKRDIFYNNAARFLRLSEEEIARHHGK